MARGAVCAPGTFCLRRCPSNVIARLPWSVRTGLALILAGIAWFGGWSCWEATRIWVPLNVPVSLSQGHIRTPEFKINVEGTYVFRVEVEPRSDAEGGPCLAGLCRGRSGSGMAVAGEGRGHNPGTARQGHPAHASAGPDAAPVTFFHARGQRAGASSNLTGFLSRNSASASISVTYGQSRGSGPAATEERR